jgi:hypothetical protein
LCALFGDILVGYRTPNLARPVCYTSAAQSLAGGRVVDYRRLLDVNHWFDPFVGPPSQLYLGLVVLFVLWTIVASAAYAFRRRFFRGNGARIGMATRFGPYAITIGGVGLFFLAMRYLQIPYFDVRFLLYLTILTAIGFVIFLAYYQTRRYPSRLAEVRAHELRQRYQPERRRKRRR